MNPRDWIRRQLRLLRRAVKNLEALEKQFAKDERKAHETATQTQRKQTPLQQPIQTQ